MNNQTLREKIVEMFNRGASHLYLHSEYESLRIHGYSFIVDLIIDKAEGKTNKEKYIEVRKKCAMLFREIRDRVIVGEYFTPRTLFLNWKYLGNFT